MHSVNAEGGGTGQPAVIQYWNTADTPSYIADLVGTVTEHNPGLPHLLFNEATAERFIAEHFTAREVAAFRACAVPAMQADYFRYCAVYALGGIYIDADVECVASLQSLIEHVNSGMVFQRLSDLRGRPRPFPAVMNGFFVFKSPGHPLLGLTLDVATVNIEQRVANHVWAATGPGIFTSLYLLHSLGSEDAFIKRCAGFRVELIARAVCDVVGSPARASEAFDGVSIGLAREINPWLRFRGYPRSKGEAHSQWFDWKGSIFRAP